MPTQLGSPDFNDAIPKNALRDFDLLIGEGLPRLPSLMSRTLTMTISLASTWIALCGNVPSELNASAADCVVEMQRPWPPLWLAENGYEDLAPVFDLLEDGHYVLPENFPAKISASLTLESEKLEVTIHLNRKPARSGRRHRVRPTTGHADFCVKTATSECAFPSPESIEEILLLARQAGAVPIKRWVSTLADAKLGPASQARVQDRIVLFLEGKGEVRHFIRWIDAILNEPTHRH